MHLASFCPVSVCHPLLSNSFSGKQVHQTNFATRFFYNCKVAL